MNCYSIVDVGCSTYSSLFRLARVCWARWVERVGEGRKKVEPCSKLGAVLFLAGGRHSTFGRGRLHFNFHVSVSDCEL